VKRLRAALGDDAENPRFVQTLPRRGYRFIAPLLGPQAVEPAPVAAPRVRLAVLPFTNLSDSAQEYFTDGLTEEMIAQLGQLCRGRIGVIARWSSMVFKGTTSRTREIGQALRADYLLEGSVRREGDRVRITARLVETAGETHLWAETYERDLVDCLSVQSDVAQRIARSLTMELMPDARVGGSTVTGDPEAYQAYLKARYYWNLPGDEGVRPCGTMPRAPPPTRASRVPGSCGPSITASCRGARSSRRASRRSARSSWSPASSRPIRRSATSVACSNGTGAAPKPSTRRPSC
jgi:TolB-like protein